MKEISREFLPEIKREWTIYRSNKIKIYIVVKDQDNLIELLDIVGSLEIKDDFFEFFIWFIIYVVTYFLVYYLFVLQ